MKKIIFPLSLIILLFWQCDEDKQIGQAYLSYIETTYGGCFKNSSIKIFNEISTDTLYVENNGIGLKLTVGLNYNCCGDLADKLVMQDYQKVDIFIEDVCVDECICRCNCSYILNYLFNHGPLQKVRFNVYLKKLGDNDYTLWKSLEYTEI